MDEITINSKIMRKILSSVISKTVGQKMGFKPEINFNDPITVGMDQDYTVIHANIELICETKDIENLLGV